MKPIYRKLMGVGMAALLSASMVTSAFAWHVDDGDLYLDDAELTATEFVIHSDAYTHLSYNMLEHSSTIKLVDLSDSANLVEIRNTSMRSDSVETVLMKNCTSLTTLGFWAFANNPNLSLIDLRGCNALKTIEDTAFNHLASEVTIYLPSNITYIDSDAFGYYEGEATVYVENEEVRARYAAMVNVPEVHFMVAPEEPEEPTFVSSITLNKNYNDLYAGAAEEGAEPAKTTAPKETLTFAIAPVTAGAPALPATVTMNVENGAGEAEIAMPTENLVYGDYWYTLTETAGSSAGVEYDDTTYFLHLIVGSQGGKLGVKYATIHVTAPAEDGSWSNDVNDKIDTITNSYAEGKLTIKQTVSGNSGSNEDEFTVTVTLTLPEDTVIMNDVRVGEDGTVITPNQWENGTVSFEVTLKGDESVVIDGLPDGTTYKVEQTKTNEDLGYTAPEYDVDKDEEDEDIVVDATEDDPAHVTGVISDGEDEVIINNEKNTPVDVGVILENGAFVMMAAGAIAAGAFLVISRKKKYEAE